MRISDWSSDVCSSDLQLAGLGDVPADRLRGGIGAGLGAEGAALYEIVPGGGGRFLSRGRWLGGRRRLGLGRRHLRSGTLADETVFSPLRSEVRRVGKEGVSTCRTRWATSN